MRLIIAGNSTVRCAVKLINRYGISKIKIRIKSGVRLLDRSALLPL